MSRLLTVNYNNEPLYDITIENNFSKLTDAFKQLNINNRKLCIITDSNVAPLYLDAVKEELSKTGNAIFSYIIPAGEANKHLGTVSEIYNHLIINKFDRNDCLVALGGGVVGDMTGYTAATYLRGIKFIQVPTTLLACVDSSIGGKTGVDFNSYKNMVGAFHQPSYVYMNTSTLKTLDKRQINCGLGEIIKHGFIKNKDYYWWIKDNTENILNLDDEIIEEMIYVSCDIKRAVVENDPKEKGERALLNFGHTLGHAIEKLSDFKLYHGECVVLGIICALHISLCRDLIKRADLDEAIATFDNLGFPLKISDITAQDILETSKSDKKMDAGKIKFILLNGVGNGYIDNTVSDEELLNAAEFVLK